MPTSIAALIILLAVLPGLPGESIYHTLVGKDWRLSDWERIAGVLSFSLIGLLLYILAADLSGLPAPIYVVPSTVDPATFDLTLLSEISISLLGHFAGSSLAGIIVAFLRRATLRLTGLSYHPASWDTFIRSYVPDHWVVVRTTSGEAYAGILAIADISVDQTERDVILSEPAHYLEEQRNYETLPYQSLFLPASLVSSVAVVYDHAQDNRTVEVGTKLFKEQRDE